MSHYRGRTRSVGLWVSDPESRSRPGARGPSPSADGCSCCRGQPPPTGRAPGVGGNAAAPAVRLPTCCDCQESSGSGEAAAAANTTWSRRGRQSVGRPAAMYGRPEARRAPRTFREIRPDLSSRDTGRTEDPVAVPATRRSRRESFF